MCALHEDTNIFYHNSLNLILGWKTFQKKDVEKIKTHIFCSVIFFENRAVYEIMRKIMVQPDRPQVTIWRMRIVCCITNATKTNS